MAAPSLASRADPRSYPRTYPAELHSDRKLAEIKARVEALGFRWIQSADKPDDVSGWNNVLDPESGKLVFSGGNDREIEEWLDERKTGAGEADVELAPITPLRESEQQDQKQFRHDTLVYGVAVIADMLEHEIFYVGGFVDQHDVGGYSFSSGAAVKPPRSASP